MSAGELIFLTREGRAEAARIERDMAGSDDLMPWAYELAAYRAIGSIEELLDSE